MESPGTAPGSDPIITGAFIAIVRASPNKTNIGRGAPHRKTQDKSARVFFETRVLFEKRSPPQALRSTQIRIKKGAQSFPRAPLIRSKFRNRL